MKQPTTIGLLDSGVGGFSVLREIRARLPGHPLLYVADSAWCPYGVRTADEIRQRVLTLTDHLLARGAELIVVACNSATIAAVETLRATYPVSFVGMEPGIKPAARMTRSGVIGVLATEASLAGEKFHRLIDTHAGALRVITRPCPDFVTLVEQGILAGERVNTAIDTYARPLVEIEGADVLVLGCTHYPFLAPAILQRVGAGVNLVDTSAAVARRVADLLPGSTPAIDPAQPSPAVTVFTSAPPEQIHDLLHQLVPDIPLNVLALPSSPA
jgi:glutamate racemase